MTAKEALMLSEKNAQDIAEQKRKDAEIAAALAERELKLRRQKWQQHLESDLRRSIEWAVQNGRRKVEHTLDSRQTHDHSSPEYSDYASELNAVMENLQNDGYAANIQVKTVVHDESGAYMNSGGECGSETPWYTNDTTLVIQW